MTMNDTNSKNLAAVTSVLQLIVICLGVGGVFFAIGTKDESLRNATEDISELKSISSDLVRSQVLSQTQDALHSQMLEDILRRLDNLER